jgi:thioredoxin-related protein
MKNYLTSSLISLIIFSLAGSVEATNSEKTSERKIINRKTNTTGITWTNNFKEAEKTAGLENKVIFANFTGSGWSSKCEKLDKEVFTKPEFINYARKNFIMLKIDFPSKKYISSETRTQNTDLKNKYNIKKFPTILLLDSEGEVLAETGYKSGGPIPYIKSLNKLIKKS